MIISHVVGGIGNQMFQYAVGTARALACQAELRLDISDFARYRIHQGFELQRVFSTNILFASAQDIRDVLGWRAGTHVKKLLQRSVAAPLRGSRLVIEPHFQYWPGIVKTQEPSYLMGYWQSERYFKEIAPVLRRYFQFRQEAVGQNAELMQRMAQCNAVSLHVRRGDYVANNHTNSVHGVCSLAYYEAAIEHIAQHVEHPEFYIFSDDIAWVRANLKIPFPSIYVSHNTGKDSYNDLRLMSACRHHVIANSSFSWWGAWLNASEEKMVIAPKRWFANDRDVNDLFCENWITL